MLKPAHDASITGLHERLAAFVLERFPFALTLVQDSLKATSTPNDAQALRTALRDELIRRLAPEELDIADPTARITAATRFAQARDELIGACDGFLQREAIAMSLTPEERREILAGMLLTRAVDNRLKQFFLGGDVRFGSVAFQGKGFRSLGQEAIYAAAIRLRRGAAYRDGERGWRGDVV